MSAFGDAITQSMVSSLDPMNQVSRDMASSMIKAKQAEIISVKEKVGQSIVASLESARDRNADSAIIEFYEKLLAETNGL